MTDRTHIQIRRIYDEPSPDDGTRVLVDRLWPRGISKGRAHLDEWCKDVAPSPNLRKWYHHEPALFEEFTRRYTDELDQPGPAAAVAHLKSLAAQAPLTLLTATRNPEISEAEVLRQVLDG
ncbi:DUF488 domain-containing protein [Mycolicibacterium vaccae]|uniref:DUF488 domain-containing protein n=1 Tax=Mycolicibacterium vaccae TaxID=1810 RepID=UPI003CF44004